jgi:hemolysin D
MSNLPSPARQKRDNAVVGPIGTAISRRRRDDSAGEIVSAFESETVSVFVRTAPFREHMVLYAVVAMILASIVLISVVKLDRVVSGTGTIIPAEGSLYVQPYNTAIIHEIRVKVGEIVKKGQVLATIDPTFASADLAKLEQTQASSQAQVERLEAEQDGHPYSPKTVDQYALLQQSLWQQRQAEYRSALTDFDSRIRSAESTVTQYQQDVEEYQKRLRLASELEQMHTTLEQHGWGSRVLTLSATDARTEINRLMSESQNQIAENRHTAASLKAQRAVYIDQWRSGTSKDLVTARDTLKQAEEDLKKAHKVSELVSLDAPADAVVLKIGQISVGSMASATGDATSQPLFTLVPLDGQLEAEIDVDSQDIGFIQVGDPVNVKLDAYSFIRHGTAKGVVKTISDGSFTTADDGSTRPPFFKVRVGITEVHLTNVPANFRLIPGMTLSGDVIIGRRTIISYLVEGGLRTGSEAMREP